jgi:hypothetical protein
MLAISFLDSTFFISVNLLLAITTSLLPYLGIAGKSKSFVTSYCCWLQTAQTKQTLTEPWIAKQPADKAALCVLSALFFLSSQWRHQVVSTTQRIWHCIVQQFSLRNCPAPSDNVRTISVQVSVTLQVQTRLRLTFSRWTLNHFLQFENNEVSIKGHTPSCCLSQKLKQLWKKEHKYFLPHLPVAMSPDSRRLTLIFGGFILLPPLLWLVWGCRQSQQFVIYIYIYTVYIYMDI